MQCTFPDIAPYPRIHLISSASSSKPSKWRKLSTQGSKSRYIHSEVPNTTNLNAHLHLYSHKAWLTALGCLSAKGPHFANITKLVQFTLVVQLIKVSLMKNIDKLSKKYTGLPNTMILLGVPTLYYLTIHYPPRKASRSKTNTPSSH